MEKYRAYNVDNFDNEPDTFIYSVAKNYESLKYFCHDPQGAKVPAVLDFWSLPGMDWVDSKQFGI
jgi:C1A family cysteine protease